MKLAFVHLPFTHRTFSENLKVVDEEFFVKPPPLILSYVAAIAEQAGHEVRVVEAHGKNLTKAQAVQEIKDFGADAICVRLDVYGFQQCMRWLSYIKEHTGLPVIVGGIGVTDYTADVMTRPQIDYGIQGEAIGRLPDLLKRLEWGESVDDVNGLAYRKDDQVIINPCTGPLTPFDEYPWPARHLLPNHLYGSFVSQRKNFTLMLTSTGCPFKCVYCAIVRLKYRYRDPVLVADEIEHCVKEHGVREIDFFDGTFFLNRGRSLTLLKEIQRRKLDVEWTCRSRVDVVNDEILREARKAGCRMIYYGIESGSSKILRNVNKETNTHQVEEAIRATRRAGIRSLGFLMIGNPGENKKTIRQTIRFARKLKLDYVQICRTIPKPLTQLDNQLRESTGRDYWGEFVRGERGEERLPMPWIDMEQEDLERELKRAYYAFYFRPDYIWRTIKQTRTPEEFARYVKVAMRMIGNHFFSDVEAVHPT